MSDIQKQLQRPLDTSDIDWRVGMAKQNGCSLLAYKDSRVDQKRLDDVFGMFGWSVEYQRDSKGVLQATVSVYNEVHNMWVSKTSNGTESMSEAQKGEYSDAFKRACFLWGIGRELYALPFIWVPFKPEEVYVTGGKARATAKFQPNAWAWTIDWDYKDKQGYNTGLIQAKQGNEFRVRAQPIIPQVRATK